MGRMTQRRMRELTEPGRYGDGLGLYFYVGKNGARSWVQRIVINGRRRDIGLGAAAVITLATARERAFKNRVEVAHGRDPFADRARSKRMPTFREAARRYFDAARDKWRSDKTRRNWVGQMELHAYPGIGDTRIDRITRADILRILAPIWSAKPDIARKLRSRLRAVLSWAQAHGYVETNIVDAVEGALPSMPAARKHFRALAYADVPAALAAVDASRASRAVKSAFSFLVMTAARSGEVRGAKWDEIDLDARTWTIPGRTHEGRPRASGAAVGCGAGRARRRAGAGRRVRLGVPVGEGQRAFGHDAFQDAAHDRDRRGSAWLPYVVQDVGQRVHERRFRGRGGLPGSQRRIGRRARLQPL